MSDVRLFLGFRVPEAVASGVLDGTRGSLEGTRLYASQDLHLTLVFLGAWPAERVDELAGVVQEELRGLPAPDLLVHGTGCFPEEGAPRALWAGVEESAETVGRLGAVVERCRQAARCLGWRPRGVGDRGPLRAHLTVARTRAEDGFDAEPFLRARPRGAWIAQDVCLFESRPDRQETRYAVRATWPLVVRPG